MKKLSVKDRARVLGALLEGVSIAGVSRMTGVAENTIDGILRHVGEACAAYHREQARGLESASIQLDEQWSFVGCREDHKREAKRKNLPGDVWIWTCLCADTKLIVNWRVGHRTMDEGMAFCADLGQRFANRPQVNSDGLTIYRQAVPRGFGRCDFGQLMKFYKEVNGKLEVVKIIKAARTGSPDFNRLSTSYVERQNLTTRMTNRRMTRLTLSYSKILENHRHMLALTYFSYNWIRRHQTIKTTPAQAAGIANYQWSWEDVVEMADARTKAEQDAEFENAFAARYGN